MFWRKFSELALAKVAVIIWGLITLIILLPQVSSQFTLIFFFAVCMVIAGFMDVQLSQGGSISIDGAVALASIMLLPLPDVLLVIAGGTIISASFQRSWHELGGIGFHVASKVITATVAAGVFHLLRGEVGKVEPIKGLVALIAMCVVYFAIEITMEELSKLKRRTPAFAALWSSAKFLLPLYLTFTSLGILLALLYGTMGPWSALFFFLSLMITRHSFKLYMDIRKAYSNTIKALANTIEAQNPERHGHAERVSDIAAMIGREIGLHGHDLELISYAALLHDIGMIGIEDDAERLDHAHVGAGIIEQVEFIRSTADMVRMHHAPVADDVPLGARIIGVACTFDELVSNALSENRLTEAQAFGRLRREQGILYDPKVLRALGSILRKQGIAFV
ncbi:MAG: HD domain-containing protein [Chloroflexi bacterium]|nr:HD domain-containing protein [Chloroflexota bacterium]